MIGADTERSLDGLLEFVRRNRGFDFTGYKRSSLERRIGKRMREVGCAGYGDYQDFLEVHPEEFSNLFNTILISVTSFFRDAPVWEYLQADVLPAIVARRGPSAPIRVWCAGCASGEEPYTMVMVLSGLLGEKDYQARVKVYATDVDEEALQAARQATYSAKQVEAVPPEPLDRCFERADGGYAVRPELRRSVIFGRNDLVQDAPISRVDLLMCRNTLMYFNAETQSRVLRRFHFGLDPAGLLVLGKSEMLITHRDLFAATDQKRRVFRKAPSTAALDPAHVADPPPDADGLGTPSLRDSAFDAGPVAQLILDRHGRVVSVNQAARALFAVDGESVGRPLQDLELSYRPIELRAPLDRVRTEGRPVQLRTVAWTGGDGEARILDVDLTPLSNGAHLDGTSISYVDVTRVHSLQDELDGSKHDLEQAYEQLQSTVEELETTNEELQSTNEELETMNEELQSTNEELETINQELRIRSLELDEANAFLTAILASMGIAVAVLDAGQTVRVWNRHAEELWGIRAAEIVGERVSSLDAGLPVPELQGCIRSALSGDASEVVVGAHDRRGRQLLCRVGAVPLAVEGDAVTGVILVMERVAA